ncbi:MAG: hypothetical protein ABIR68_15440 [Ilumatobacteraceae bacterium]
MTTGRWRAMAPILVAAGALVGACGSDGTSSSGITLETLAATTTGTACLLPFDVVASTTGVDSATPASGSVIDGRLADSTLPAQFPASDAEAVDGVAVTCSMELRDGGELTLLLLAGKSGDAGLTMVPKASYAAGLNTDQSEQLANDIARSKVGTLVPVPGTAAVAVIRTKVNGATSAAMLISSTTLKRGPVEQLARQLDQRLH